MIQQPANSQGTFSLFTGVVEACDSGTYSVILSIDQARTNGLPSRVKQVPITFVLGSILGIKEAYLPQPGTAVFQVYHSGSSLQYILGAIPREDVCPIAPLKTVEGQPEAFEEIKNLLGRSDGSTSDRQRQGTYNNNRPADLNEFEFGYVNEFGILFALYPFFQQLKASELQQIQFHIFDDLVRLISKNYSHITALGEYKVTQDGDSIYGELNASHMFGEQQGIVDQEGKSNLEIDENQDISIKDDKQSAIQRLNLFWGRLGDFLKIFLSKPNTNRLPDGSNREETPNTGLFDVHLSQEGGISIRSVSYICFELVNWIRVPERVLQAEDPSGNKETSFEEKEPFEWDDREIYNTPTGYALQLRQFLQYVQEELAYKNFNKLDKDFVVPDDPTVGVQAKNVNQIDDLTKVDLDKGRINISGIYMLPNGGIVLRDGSQSSIVMEGGQIQLQSQTDTVLQPMRHLVQKVGQCVSIASKKDIELSSTEEGIRLKQDKPVYIYSHNSGIVLHSNVASPANLTANDRPEENMGGINLISKGYIQLSQDNLISQLSGNMLQLKSELFYNEADRQITNAQTIMSFGERSHTIYSGNALVQGARGSQLFQGAGQTVLGLEEQTMAVQKFGEASLPVQGLQQADFLDSITTQLEGFSFEDIVPEFFSVERAEELKFKFQASDTYNLQDNDYLFETWAQQSNKLTGTYRHVGWTEEQINDTYPYPGQEKWDNFLLACETTNMMFDNTVGIYNMTEPEDNQTLTTKSLNEYVTL